MHNKTRRDMVDISPHIKLSQGSIFNYAFNEVYQDEEILGLLITARCDISNAKTPKYSYLPTIPFFIWKNKELPNLLKDKLEKSKENEAKEALKKAGISPNSIKIFGAEATLSLAREKIKPKSYASLEKKVIEYVALKDKEDFESLYSYFSSDIEKIINEIITNKNMNYFFIDQVGEYGPCLVKLREVSHVDREVADKINDGIDPSLIGPDNYTSYRSLNIMDKDSLICLIGILKSPYIERLMQRFADNFTRVGVDNPHDNMCKEICSGN